jgi:hypothetical protein
MDNFKLKFSGDPMTSAINPLLPADGVPASKHDLRQNLQAARNEIEALQTVQENELATTSQTVDAAYFGNAAAVFVRCTSGSAVAVTLEADVAAGKGIHIVQWGVGIVTVEAGPGAVIRKPAAASLSTAEQYDSLVLVVARNDGGAAAEWLLI